MSLIHPLVRQGAVRFVFGFALVALATCDSSGRHGSPARPSEAPPLESGATQPTQASESLVLIPSTQIKLIPPEGFQAASTFTGFEEPTRGSSILVVSMPGPFAEIRSTFEDTAALAARGMTSLGREDMPMSGTPGRLYRIDQHTGEQTVQKWVWLVGTSEETQLIMGTCVVDCDAQLPILRRSVLSAQWDRSAERDPSAGLGFALTDTGGLAFQGRQTNNLIYSDKNRQIFFLVGPAMNAGATADKLAFAKQRFLSFPFEDISIEGTRKAKIDGLDGYAVIGQGVDPDGVQMFMYSTILYESENYWILFGNAPLAKRREYEPVFDRMANSLRRDKSAPSQ